MLRALLLVLGSVAASIAQAGVSSTLTLASDYDFRGFTQTDEDPALQASLDYAQGDGWYVGAWASNVDYPGYDGSVELDLYTGFAGSLDSGVDWDVGLVWYTYPGSRASATEAKLASYPEIYGELSYGPVSGGLWYSNDFGGSDENAIYLDGNIELPLPRDFSIRLHAGYSDGDGIAAVYGVSNYFDYSFGVGYAIRNFDLGLKYVDTDIDGYDGDRLVFTVSTTLPWSKD